VNASDTNEDPHGGEPNRKPQIGRREIGAFLLLEAGAAAPQPAASLILAGR